MAERFGPEHLETWRRDGAVLIPEFFTAEEVAGVAADFQTVFGRSEGAGEGLDRKSAGEVGHFHPAQFKTLDAVPFDCSPALNLIGVHPALVSFARQALGADEVHLYQCNVWAKFTGDADYDQPFHTDFSNHTLTVPAEDARLNSVTILCYFSDVTDAHGPAHYVTRPDSSKVAGPELSLSGDREIQARLQEGLGRYARSNAAPAGSIFPYGIDVYHRGTNMTAPQGHRFAVMACFKDAANDVIGYHAWPFHHRKPWRRIFDHASPEQLACFGVKRPGHPFWTEATLRRAQARYPGWDMTPYRDALAA
ncbi:MAG TPA: phytanoyl-CoA dioxygenase family protein [Caulobacteraceae bacterium]|nr:phytanoyl-CoA dioxygenase family protein [Caulobacteraceae bacterium]